MTDSQKQPKPNNPPVVEQKKRGRKKNSNFLTFEQAKQFVRDECIASKTQFDNWWNANKSKTIPRFPHRVYQKEWKGWNDFLGTNNEFAVTKKLYRPYHEAVLWVHELKLEKVEQWLDFCKNAPNFPEDIPRRPDIVYKKDWHSWNHWLGNKPIEKIEARKEAQKIAVFYIIKEADYIGDNVLTFGVEHLGVNRLKQRWEKNQNFSVVRLYWYDPSKGNEIQNIINNFSSEYYGNSSVRIVPNIFDITWHLERYLEVVPL